jgi:hypothetical protein
MNWLPWSWQRLVWGNTDAVSTLRGMDGLDLGAVVRGAHSEALARAASHSRVQPRD